MFKKLNELEQSMYNIMLKMKDADTDLRLIFRTLDKDSSIAIHQCIYNNYIENIEEWKDADGNYHFDIIGNVHLNQDGLKFLRNMSFPFRLKNFIFDILKGTLGFILGILGTVIAEIIIWKITSP